MVWSEINSLGRPNYERSSVNVIYRVAQKIGTFVRLIISSNIDQFSNFF